jgi:hypothetical protein
MKKTVLVVAGLVLVFGLTALGIQKKIVFLLRNGSDTNMLAAASYSSADSASYSSQASSLCNNRELELKNASGWLPIGPNNGRVNSFERSTDGQTWYIGSNYGGAYKSLDQGKTWKNLDKVSNGNILYAINAIKFIKGNLYAASAEQGILKLINDVWQPVFTINDPKSWIQIDYDKTDDVIYALNEAYGLYSSKDGLTWSKIKIPALENQFFSTFYITRNGHLLVSGAPVGLEESDNGGLNWKKIFGIPVNSIAEDDKGALYFRTWSDLYKQNTASSSFVHIKSVFADDTPIAFIDGNLISNTNFNVITLSKDYGKTFNDVPTEIKYENLSSFNNVIIPTFKDAFYDMRSIYDLGSGKIAISNDNGLSIMDLTNNSIIPSGDIPTNNDITGIAAVEKENTIFTAYYDHGPKVTTDCGLTWQDYNGWEFDQFYSAPSNDSAYIYIDAASGGKMVLRDFLKDYTSKSGLSSQGILNPQFNSKLDGGAVSNIYPYRFYTVDGGSKLISVSLDSKNPDMKSMVLPFGHAIGVAIDNKNPNRILVVSGVSNTFFIYESIDSGVTWNLYLQYSFGGPNNRKSFSIDPYDSSKIILSGVNGNVFLITNKIVQNIQLPYDLSQRQYNETNVVLFDPWIKDLVYAGSSQGFFYSIDGGKTWRKYDKGLYSENVNYIIPLSDRILIGTYGSGAAIILKSKLGISSPATFYFGGMIGSGRNASGTTISFNNPLTGSSTCPTGYTKSKVLGTTNVDEDLFVCSGNSASTIKLADFGGLIGTGLNMKYSNPTTGTSTCPTGFTRTKILGTPSKDWNLFMCHKPDTVVSSTDLGFRGMYGYGYSVSYSNPITGTSSCSNGDVSTQIFGTINKGITIDYPLWICGK